MSQPPRSSVTWSVLRVGASLSIVFALACDGFTHRSPWAILLAVPALTVLRAIGLRGTWAPGSRARLLARMALIQAMAAAAGYLVGLGLGALFAQGRRIAPLAELDLWTASVFLVLALGLGVLDSWLNESEPEEAAAPGHH